MTEYDAYKVIQTLAKTWPEYIKEIPQDFPLLSRTEEDAIRLMCTKVEPQISNPDIDFRQWHPARMIYQGQEYIYVCFETRQYRTMK